MLAADLARAAAPDREQPQPTVLVVNDNPGQRMAIRAVLAPLGVSVVEVDSGRAALRAVLRQTFALILMDVRMPTMDGYETAKLIRQHKKARPTPIIFVTAFGREDTDTLAAYASGAVDFVFTPVVPDVLRAKVSVFVDLFVQSELLHLKSQKLQLSLESITTLNAALRDGEASTQAVLDNVADGILIADGPGLIESVNRSAEALFGYCEAELIGRPLTVLVAPGHENGFSDLLSSPAVTKTSADARNGTSETVGRRQDGSTFPMEVEHGELKLSGKRRTLAFVRDISERKAYTESLKHQTLHDGLTGLANSALFEVHVIQAIGSAKRKNEPRAVLVMDLDGFKQVNDSLGHAQGDVLLKQVAGRLVAALRDSDSIARLGGDEFAILPGEATDLTAATAVAWKIQRACATGFKLDHETVTVSASIGIAIYPEHGRTSAELLRRADVAMYVAKRSGTGHASVDVAQEAQTADQVALLVDLRECVHSDQLVLHYQPKIDLGTRAISGVEALIRWRHPTRGLLPPGSFIPEVERTALIAPVTRWVLNEALRQQQIWREQGFDLTMAVNVSARSLGAHTTLAETVQELTAAWKTRPGELILELTEGALIEAAATDVLARLHKMGGRLSIDDFGTGYSSLAYLQRLPMDEIKIDRSFVTGLGSSSDNSVIVRSTIDLAHNLGLAVVAEGVEDHACMNMLIRYGCDRAQGYFFGRPCPADELTAWLANSPFGVHPESGD